MFTLAVLATFPGTFQLAQVGIGGAAAGGRRDRGARGCHGVQPPGREGRRRPRLAERDRSAQGGPGHENYQRDC